LKNSARSENRRKSLNSIGLSSLLVIFVVLASVTLSVMCLITVRQDLDRAKKLAVTHEEYYSADTKATEKLDSLYLLLADDSVTDISAAARDLGIEVTGGTWSETVNSGSRLVCKAEYENENLVITSWQIISNNYYEEENSLPVWNGESLPV
jgi:hypothetical protein